MCSLHILLPLLPFIFISSAYADLQNSDFEASPSNIVGSSNSPYGVLNGSNSLPGWTIEGTVEYVTAGPNMDLPSNTGGHAVKLGFDGKINQTFIADHDNDDKEIIMQYVLTFTLASTDVRNCSTKTSVIVAAPDRSTLIHLEGVYGKERWESHGTYLGSWGGGEGVNLVMQSQLTEADPNGTCGPVVDALLLKKIGSPIQVPGNLISNGGFEVGPAFLPNSTEGVLLDPEQSVTQSALQQWSVLGTVKYIDSMHYYVPEGKAAIEIVSGGSSGGIQTVATLEKDSTYKLEFVMGDANNSCVGELIVGAQAGSKAQNFTMHSQGIGFAQNCSMTFKADSSSPTVISFVSFTSTKSRDLVFCGPVIDNVVVQSSNGVKHDIELRIVAFLIVFLVATLKVNG